MSEPPTASPAVHPAASRGVPPTEQGEIEAAIEAFLQAEVVSAGVAKVAAAGFWALPSPGQRPYRALGFAGGATERSVFDLASITKTCVALTTSLLIERGVLRWKTRLSELLPWLAATAGGAATVEAHLSHRAGLAAHRELFLAQQAGLAVRRRELLLAAARAARSGRPEDPVYSDLGYLLVGAGLETLLGKELFRIVEEELTMPRGWAIASARSWRSQRAATFPDAVPTEIVANRGGTVRGLVHDDNAWALSGSALSGHAGLFGTITGVLDLAHSLVLAALQGGELGRAVLPLLERRPGGSLRLGLDGVSEAGASGTGSAAGSLVGPNTFGHLGFTGTSFWCDPDQGLAFCLLTNRVHPSRQNQAIRAARPRVHDGLVRLARRAVRAGP